MVFKQEVGEERHGEIDFARRGDWMRPMWMRLSWRGEVRRWFSAPHARATSTDEDGAGPVDAMAAR